MVVQKKRGARSSDLDYAASADALADDRLERNDDSSVEDNENSAEDDGSEHRSHDDRDSKAEYDDEGTSDDESSEGESDACSDNEEQIIATPKGQTLPSLNAVNTSNEPCSFDLRNLISMNTHQIDTKALYSKKKRNSVEEEKLSIPPTLMDVTVNENYLLQKAKEGCAQLIASLWQQPISQSDVGPMVILPSYEEIKIPRAMAPPPPKQETKWEKFAKEKGLPLNKNKRSRKVWDESTGTWMYRHGYQKANDDTKEWPIMEVQANQDPYEDPWERLRDEKRRRTDKNTESRLRNQERAGALPKGTATRIMKNREKTRQAGKAGGNMDRDHVDTVRLKGGIPVDLPSSKTSEKVKPSQRGKASTMAALVATQRSTASLGKFDRLREGEPDRKKAMSAAKKRHFESATDRKVTSTEADRSMKLLKAVVDGGGAEKERARKKGKLAKGETAYDYDFDDGLGPSTFRKKKGRAGAGKVKKMTKKRAK